MANQLGSSTNIGCLFEYNFTGLGNSDIFKCNYFGYLTIYTRSVGSFNSYKLQMNFNASDDKPIQADPWWYEYNILISLNYKDIIGIKIPCWLRIVCITYNSDAVVSASYGIPFDHIIQGG